MMERIIISGKEMRTRFICDLEKIGYDPYIFSEGLADDDTDFELSLEDWLKLGTLEEFDARFTKTGRDYD